MKRYIIKTVARNIYGEIYSTQYSKEYKSLPIAQRYLNENLEQTIIERTIWFDKNYKKHYSDKAI